MDSFDVLLQVGLITSGLVVYLLFRRTAPKHGNYTQADWNYSLKYLFGRYAVRGWKSDLPDIPASEEPLPDLREGWDAVSVRATAPDGTAVFLSIRKLCARQPLGETIVYVKLPDGTTYLLPKAPEASVGAWEVTSGAWSANGLKIQILEPKFRWRILYNGLLTRQHDKVTHHVKLNFIWMSANAVPVRYPKDWSNQLAAQALAFEPWRDSKWSQTLGKWKDGSWVQFGAMQGRFQAFDEAGATETSVYLQTRGVRERSWAPSGYQGLRRTVFLTAAASDGTVVQLKCMSYNNVLTQLISGTVRFPNYSVENITNTDLVMADFCEKPELIPKVYTINVSTSTRVLKLFLRVNEDGARYLSGVPSQHDVTIRTLVATIDGYSGAGLCELGYETRERKEPSSITKAPILRWLSTKEAGGVSYCVSLEERAAGCPDYVGGKGASLALLASVQKDEGYRVPPGFCLTIKALEKHLEQNPDIKAAIKDIEAANDKFVESNFKAKCEKASSLFAETEITGDVKEEILSSMTYLRQKKALEENLGPHLRFAVRSSAVGEDSEVLSAAGQNETILGCETDDDVLKGVQKCWGSMFAFTSAYYRRQNGQACACGGGVVVQALASARAAGVLFTRHPAAADPSRLLLTANYGLGESVVSGAVEPDTFIIKRTSDSSKPLVISETVLGAKKQRVAVTDNAVTFEEVPESERSQACLSDNEVLKLAKLGAVQDELWGAGRDIEWAFVGNEIFLLQARPITALERWTEEELLHELDFPVMSDDELTTFANAGEVMPRPLTPLSFDLMYAPLAYGLDLLVSPSDATDHSLVITHHRVALCLYNSVYRMVGPTIDTDVRMIEMAVHGHTVADDVILATAQHRNPPRWYRKLWGIATMAKVLIKSKSCMKASVKGTRAMTIDIEKEDNLVKIMNTLDSVKPKMMEYSYNHSITSMASTSSQFIAMNVLLEGTQDFSSEICNEIALLLSSGDVLSAEVPNTLAKLARMLEASGHYDQFRALDPKDAMKWLKRCLPHIYLDVCTFLDNHGYRAIMEFDLYTKPWIMKPEDMMKVLQTLKASPEDTTTAKSDAEIIASLKSPRKSSTRAVLRWVMPLCRHMVRNREATKAHLILAVHKLRLAALRLAALLVRRWYLPHEDLVFFFREHELRSYIETRDPGLLRKAIQRHQYYPRWCQLKFAELNRGWVSPLAPQAPALAAGDVKITAASVCGGEVVARACVVKDLSEIDQLQQGDILITHATDIGWSPYFPILAGIVTELGGLISHGAVIAREYGLPCIVGATGATDIFRTGDLVRLSGAHGSLEKVTLNETEHSTHS